MKMETEIGKTQEKYWITDTKALVGGVFFGIVFTIVCVLADVVDAVLDPSLALLGGTVWAIFTAIIAMIYGQPAGIIGGAMQTLISMATGMSPLGFFFIFAKCIGSIVYISLARSLNMNKSGNYVITQFVTSLVGFFFVGIGTIVVYSLPFNVALACALIGVVVTTIVAPPITKRIVNKIKKSGLT